MAHHVAADHFPPSTLAAQLVDNFAHNPSTSFTSTTHYAPGLTAPPGVSGTNEDEMRELVQTAMRIKEKAPDSYNSPAEHIADNHVLAFAFCRLHISATQADLAVGLSPSQGEYQASTVTATTEFLAQTLRETAAVLDYRLPAGQYQYLQRGSEPFWVWLVPQVLSVMGYDTFLSDRNVLEDCVGNILYHAMQIKSSNPAVYPKLLEYLKDAVNEISGVLLNPNPISYVTDIPPVITLDRILGENDKSPRSQLQYTISDPARLIRQATSILQIIINHVLLEADQDVFLNYGLWALDSLQFLGTVAVSMHEAIRSDIGPLINLVLPMLNGERHTTVSAKIITHEKAPVALALLCSELASYPEQLAEDDSAGIARRTTFSKGLIALTQHSVFRVEVARLVASYILPKLDMMVALSNPGPDFGKILVLLREATEHPSPGFYFSYNARPETFTDATLRDQVSKLTLNWATQDETGTPVPKRRKFGPDDVTKATTIQQLVYKHLDIDLETEPLEAAVVSAFPSMDDTSRCVLLELISHYACAADETLEISNITGAGLGSTTLSCEYCMTLEASPMDETEQSLALKGEMLRAMACLVVLPEFEVSHKPRIVAMVALQKILLHLHTEELYDLQKSTLGLWCLKSLSSHVREIRVAAARTFPLLLRDVTLSGVDAAVITRNRNQVIGLLKQISDRKEVSLFETCIMAWGQLGRVLPDFEVIPVIVQLVDFLGHSNSTVVAMAGLELRSLGQSRDKTPMALVQPFWRYISHKTLSSLDQRPQLSGNLAELLNVSLDKLMAIARGHALPYLTLEHNTNIIQRIAASAKLGVVNLFLHESYMARVLAVLLVYYTERTERTDETEEAVMQHLLRIDKGFAECTVGTLMRQDMVPTIHELLLVAAAAKDDDKKEAALNALKWCCLRIISNKEAKKRPNEVIGLALQHHLLGLVSRMNDMINPGTVKNWEVTVEQAECIRAMELLILVCKSHVRMAKAQISAALLSAMAAPVLSRPALSAWAALIMNLDEGDVEMMLELAYYVVTQHWNIFDAETKVIAEQFILDLHAKYSGLFSQVVFKLPALRQTPKLAALDDRLALIKRDRESKMGTKKLIEIFVQRIQHENPGVVWLGLGDLVTFLRTHQSWLQASSLSESPDTVVSLLLRALLDVATRYNGGDVEICRLVTECLGLIGCLDCHRVDASKERRRLVIYNNFQNASERAEFGFFLLTEVLLKSFIATTHPREQGFLAYAMQEVLKSCDITTAVNGAGTRGRGSEIAREWAALQPSDRELLSVFMTSRYVITSSVQAVPEIPGFLADRDHALWLKDMVSYLICNPQNDQAAKILQPLQRVVRIKETLVAEALLPGLFCHVIIGCKTDVYMTLTKQILVILEHEVDEVHTSEERRNWNLYNESAFNILDYMMRYVHKKKIALRLDASQTSELDRVQGFLDRIPPQIIATRAIACGQFNRALFHAELYIRETSPNSTDALAIAFASRKKNNATSGKTGRDGLETITREELMAQLHQVYGEIDEPDGLQGISAHLQDMDIAHEILTNKKAQKWTAVQTWCEYQLSQQPDDSDVQMELLNCLKNSAQYDVLLSYASSMKPQPNLENKISSYAVEAAWATGRWNDLTKLVCSYNGNILDDFNLSIGEVFRCLYNKEYDAIPGTITMIRDKISAALTSTTTSSLQACRGLLLQCHVLSDLEMILANKEKATAKQGPVNNDGVMTSLGRRLSVLGSFTSDKQYILNIQRAAMELVKSPYTELNIASLWIASGRMSRKAGMLQQSFNAVLHASNLGDDSAIIERAKLLYREGHGRRAILILESAISNNKLGPSLDSTGKSLVSSLGATSSSSAKLSSVETAQRRLIAHAQLLVAKWLDAMGQTNIIMQRNKFQQVSRTFPTWEKGHYWLGRHYKKVLEFESKLPSNDQSDATLIGLMRRVLIENYLRSLSMGTKYMHQTLPRVITVWLEFAAMCVKDGNETTKSISGEVMRRRQGELKQIHEVIDKFTKRLPAYILYTALAQLVARITHPHSGAVESIVKIIGKVTLSYPRQALWSIIPLLLARRSTERRNRGKDITDMVTRVSSRTDSKHDPLPKLALDVLLRGRKLATELMLMSEVEGFPANVTTATTLAHLKFNVGCLPCPLVVPTERCLMAKMPTLVEGKKKHQPFTGDVITIAAFEQEVLIMGSLARPRRVVVIGSDGLKHKLLVKPKDDLRADQRLIEFNSIINKALKKDTESSKRQLYVRTYAVTPLGDEGGIIEWVDGLRTLRDIITSLYKQRGFANIPFSHLEHLMTSAHKDTSIFTRDVLSRYPAVFHIWFMDNFPDPTAWFTARLRYTRSCAVMSMVGTIIGLGDRHGENILVEEGNGGIFHVDFNCLFDKGLTFSTPERVPFRLTHNMVAAMGIYGYEGPFRTCAELTLAVLRAQEETLLTIIEAFVYDPTIDLQREKRRGTVAIGDGRIRLNPESAFEGVKRKLAGFLPDEMIPMGVEGQVEELIKQAVDLNNLVRMYIGWSPFF